MELRRHNINCQCHTCQGCARQRAAVPPPQPRSSRTATSTATATKAKPSKKVTAPPPAPPAAGRSYLCAFAGEFKLQPAKNGAAVPLVRQQGEGGYGFKRGVITIPADGFYMLLWELGVEQASCHADLRLGINQTGTVLSEALAPGYDSGQQITWLCRGDQISLQFVGDGGHEVHTTQAQLTVLRMG